jgi:DNA-directed RNA polymerase specialized sigma24 family protein
MQALAQAVADWPTTQRRVFTLRKVYELASPEIARRLGLTESDVEHQLIQAALACSRHFACGRVRGGTSPEPDGAAAGDPPAPKVDP